MKKNISTNLESVRCVIGQSTRKHNTITMIVSPDEIIEAVKFFDDRKKGIKPKEGLIGYELVAVYAEPDPDKGKHRELDLDLVDEAQEKFLGCAKCKNLPEDGMCLRDCCHNSNAITGSPNLFEEKVWKNKK